MGAAAGAGHGRGLRLPRLGDDDACLGNEAVGATIGAAAAYGPSWWGLEAALSKAAKDVRPTWGRSGAGGGASAVAEAAARGKLVRAADAAVCGGGGGGGGGGGRGRRLTFGAAFMYAGRALDGKLVALLNADVHLDDTAAALLDPRRWDWGSEALALLRWEAKEGGRLPVGFFVCCTPAIN